MKFTVVKTITVTTKELYGIEIAEHLDPLDYMGSMSPTSTIRERDIKVDIFKEGAKAVEESVEKENTRRCPKCKGPLWEECLSSLAAWCPKCQVYV